MVSIRTIGILAALAVGVTLFFGAGGFKGVGTKIGGFFGSGFSDFSSAISSSFTGGLFGGQTGAANVVNVEGTSSPNQNQVENPPPFGIPPFLNPVTNQLAIFQGIIDQLKGVLNFGQQAFGETAVPILSPGQLSSFNFANLQAGGFQSPDDFVIKPRQGTAVARTGESFISNLGGRERAFGSQESLNSFTERFNR